MYCLANICYVCLEKKNELIRDINSSLSVNKDMIHIIGYLPFNLAWLKTMRIILICDECCLRLRETCQFLEKCLKNSALLQGYVDLVNGSPILNTQNEAELLVNLNKKNKNINEVNVETKLDEEIFTFQWKQDIAETEDVFVNFEDSFVKDENTWKREEIDDNVENLMGINTFESIDKEAHSEISVSDNARTTNTNSVSSGFTPKQIPVVTNKRAKKSYKCSTCSASFVTKSDLNIHRRIHTDEKSYECAICNKHFSRKLNLVVHMRVHTGVKPYECATCKKCFTVKSNLMSHMRIHSGEKPYECGTCNKCFSQQSNLESHMRIHSGEKPYECATCKKCFSQQAALVSHIRTHTGEKPYECGTCKKCFRQQSALACHMRIHTGEHSYECATCKKCFKKKSNLASHVRIHTGEKPM